MQIDLFGLCHYFLSPCIIVIGYIFQFQRHFKRWEIPLPMVMVIVTADDVVVAAPSRAMGNVLLVPDTRVPGHMTVAIKDIVVVVLRIAL